MPVYTFKREARATIAEQFEVVADSEEKALELVKEDPEDYIKYDEVEVVHVDTPYDDDEPFELYDVN